MYAVQRERLYLQNPSQNLCNKLDYKEFKPEFPPVYCRLIVSVFRHISLQYTDNHFAITGNVLLLKTRRNI